MYRPRIAPWLGLVSPPTFPGTYLVGSLSPLAPFQRYFFFFLGGGVLDRRV